MDVDKALIKLGKFGRFQIIFYVIICLATNIPGCWHMLATFSHGIVPEHRCKIPALNTNDTTNNDNSTTGIYGNLTNPADRYYAIDSCFVYDNHSLALNDSTMSTTTTMRCSDFSNDWEYSGDVTETIVSKWNLVCENSYRVKLAQSVFVFGVMTGAMVFSCLADQMGRKPVFLFCQWTLTIVGVITAFVGNYFAFLALRFIAGAMQQGIIITGTVMVCELFAAKQRTFAGIFIEDFWGTCTCLLALLAYLLPNWVHLQLFISLSGLLTIPLYWILPESIPWLCANDGVAEAEEILAMAARMNGIDLPKHVLSTSRLGRNLSVTPQGRNLSMTSHGRNLSVTSHGRNIISTADCETTEEEKKMEEKEGKEEEEEEEEEWEEKRKKSVNFIRRYSRLVQLHEVVDREEIKRYTLLDLIRHRILRTRALIMGIIWLVITYVYYGLTLNTKDLAGNRYLNFFLSGLVEIPAYTSSYFVLQKWGRRLPLLGFHVLAGVSLIVSNFIPESTGGGVSLHILKTIFTMAGKFGITAAFGIVFLYAPELFPTTLRSQGTGISSFCGRLGNLIAPFATALDVYVPWLSALLFGTASIGGGLLVLFLPETKDRPLPHSIEEIENWSTTKNDSTKTSPDIVTSSGKAEVELENKTIKV